MVADRGWNHLDTIALPCASFDQPIGVGRKVADVAETTKIELTEGLHLWSAGAHTVASIEVQAIRLWAAGLSGSLIAQSRTAPEADRDGMRMLAGLLRGAARDTDEKLATMLLLFKELEVRAGRTPMSMDPVRQ